MRLAREAALNTELFATDSKAKIFASVLAYQYFGYPKDFMQSYQKGVQG